MPVPTMQRYSLVSGLVPGWWHVADTSNGKVLDFEKPMRMEDAQAKARDLNEAERQKASAKPPKGREKRNNG